MLRSRTPSIQSLAADCVQKKHGIRRWRGSFCNLQAPMMGNSCGRAPPTGTDFGSRCEDLSTHSLSLPTHARCRMAVSVARRPTVFPGSSLCHARIPRIAAHPRTTTSACPQDLYEALHYLPRALQRRFLVSGLRGVQREPSRSPHKGRLVALPLPARKPRGHPTSPQVPWHGRPQKEPPWLPPEARQLDPRLPTPQPENRRSNRPFLDLI
mmetsp:Transcript_65733/g.183043  ORF Transcript_65733/g.183043 Transcript_65733/m.183043 type:complete len:211 (-) Transcript_65733:35-667(-)